jgi:hypothetical protein
VDWVAKGNHRIIRIRNQVKIGNQGLSHSSVSGDSRSKDLESFWISTRLKKRRYINALQPQPPLKELLTVASGILPFEPDVCQVKDDLLTIPYDHGIEKIGQRLRIERTGTARYDKRVCAVTIF